MDPNDRERKPFAPPDTVPGDPEGPDPPTIPDPMPVELQRTEEGDEAFKEANPMKGEAPSG